MLFAQFKFGSNLLKAMMLCLLLTAQASADDLVRLNIVAFEKRDPNFAFDSIITGTYADLFQSMQSKADVIFLNRTPVLRHMDVVNLQLDAMRIVGDEKLANEGLNCQFSFNNQSDEDSQFYSLAGMCSILDASKKGTDKARFYIKRTMLSDVNYGNNAWMLIHEDKQRGVAVYADVDPK